MRVLLVHNSYQHYGGEDAVFASERELLAQNGVQVVTYVQHNDRIKDMGRLGLAVNTVWSRQSGKELYHLVRHTRPDVVHFHNTFPLISPAGYYACARAGVPVVQTLHNYRLLCPAATFLRGDRPCEDCLDRLLP